MGKKDKLRLKDIKNEFEDNHEEKPKEVEIKSKQYNNDYETELKRREHAEETNDAIMWGFVIGFALFFILLIIIVVCTK